MTPRTTGTALLALVLVVVTACSGGDDDASTTTAPPPPATDPPATDPPATDPASTVADDASTEQLLAAMPTPDEADPSAESPCERYGYACNPLDATDEQLTATTEALAVVTDAMDGSDDAREQLRLALAALAEIEGVGHVEADLDAATMVAFTVGDGPKAAAFTVASLLQEGGEVVPVDESFAPPEGTVAPRGLRRVVPERYEPAGGPGNDNRTAAVFNPFDWESAGGIAAIFRAEEEYSTVDVFNGADVNPFTVETVGGYDAVHIITHGGGSCPSWTDDRSECASTFVGGPFDVDVAREALDARDSSVALDFWICESGGVTRYCINSGGFPANPDGIVFFGSCGSDFGFNTTGAGASVGWTGTTQQRVAERTATKFWELMVTEGVEFELAKEIVQGGGYDSHQNTFWASGGSVNAFTSAMFEGRNLRARDVVEMRLDGEEPRGQTLQFTGLPEDGRPETFPAKGQEITFTVEGVRDGTAAGVTIEIRGDGEVWPSDLNLEQDGTISEQHDGYATWRVGVDADDVEIPDVSWADLSASRAPVELEIRAFESSGEYTAYRGTVRLGTDVEFTGPLPVFTELENGLPANGQLTGNDLRVMINTGTGELTGSMQVELSASGIAIGQWQLSLTGTYDPTTDAVQGEVDGTSEGSIVDIRVTDQGSGTFTGAANLPAETITIQLGIGTGSQTYTGTVVR